MKRRPGRIGFIAFLAGSAIASAIATLVVLSGLAARRTVADFISGGMPEDVIAIGRGGAALGPIRLAGDGPTPELAGELARDPGVAEVAIEEALNAPARVRGSLFGFAYGSDVAVIGVDPTLARWMLGERSNDFRDGVPLPVAVPSSILDAYNGAFAEANGLPQLSGSAFLGRVFSLDAGVSSLRMHATGFRSTEARIAGFTSRRDLLGILVPLDYVRRMHRELGADPGNRRILLRATDPAAAERLVARMTARGFAVNAPSGRLRMLAALDMVATLIFAAGSMAASFLCGALALFAAMASLLLRREDAEILHQFGLSRNAVILRLSRRLLLTAMAGALGGTLVGFLLHGFLTIPLASRLGAPLPPIDGLQAAAALLAACIVPSLGGAAGILAGGREIIPEWRDRA